jgi:hypothetical protein
LLIALTNHPSPDPFFSFFSIFCPIPFRVGTLHPLDPPRFSFSFPPRPNSGVPRFPGEGEGGGGDPAIPRRRAGDDRTRRAGGGVQEGSRKE